jgi:hypothetical protein
MKKKSRHQQYIVQQLRNNQQKQQQIQQHQQGLNPGSQNGLVMGHPVQQQIQTPVGFEPMPTQQQSAYPQHHFEPPQHFQPPPPRRHIYVHEPCN